MYVIDLLNVFIHNYGALDEIFLLKTHLHYNKE